MVSRPEIVPVILAGGMGKRLWPLTGKNRPKPFLSFGSGTSLFQKTILRAKSFDAPIIVCHKDYKKYVHSHLSKIKIKERLIITEPCHRSTAAAIAMAAFYLRGKGSLMLVLPSDHILEETRIFKKAVMESIAYTVEDIVLLGVRPTNPETGYGYITYGRISSGANIESAKGSKGKYFRTLSFIEKPDIKKAKSLIDEGNCLWNTGIFLCRPTIFLQKLRQYEPELYKTLEEAFKLGKMENSLFQPDEGKFCKAKPISVDYAVMEKSSSLFVREMQVRWSDVGTFRRLLHWRFGKDYISGHG